MMITLDNGSIGLFLVMEHMENDIKKLLNYSSDIDLSEEHILMIIYNTLCAIKFLHSANVIHRDLKPANILIDSDCNVKICDFGLARSLADSAIGKGSGNSKRFRDSIHQAKLI